MTETSEVQKAASVLLDFAKTRGQPDEVMIANDTNPRLNGVGCRWGNTFQAVAFDKEVDPMQVKVAVDGSLNNST